MMACAPNTLCRAPEGVFQLHSPCLSDDTLGAASQYFPNQTVAIEYLKEAGPCKDESSTSLRRVRSAVPIGGKELH